MARILCATTLLSIAAFAANAEPLADKLPPGAIARLGSYRYYHGGLMGPMRISPDGKFVVTVGVDYAAMLKDKPGYSLCVFDAQTGERRWSKPVAELSAWPMTLSPDGKVIAVNNDATISLFAPATGVLRTSFPASAETDTGITRELTFSSDGRQLIQICHEGCVNWIDVASGNVIRHRTPWPHGKPMGAANGESGSCNAT